MEAPGYRGLMITLLVVGGLNTALSLFYYLRVVKTMAIDPEPAHRPTTGFSLGVAAGSVRRGPDVADTHPRDFLGPVLHMAHDGRGKFAVTENRIAWPEAIPMPRSIDY